MAGTTALEFLITATDKASDVFDKIGSAASRNQNRIQNFSAKSSVALAAVGLVAIKFGSDSIAAFEESEVAQAKLVEAYKKFPKMADTTVAALQDINSALALKTGYDDDATASAQAVLAQFDLTGKQIAELTPLLQDYAAKTGKDLPTAAQDLGKAMMGQGRALKAVGIDFQDAGSVSANFEQILAGLQTQVGGTAEMLGGTAAGKAAIFRDQVGELQESVGALLVPVMGKLVEVSSKTVAAFNKTGNAGKITVGVLGGLVVALAAASAAGKAQIAVQGIMAVLSGRQAAATGLQTAALAAQKIALGISTAAQWAFNAAMTANPVGLVIAAIGALVAAFIWAYNNIDWFREGVNKIWDGIVWYFETAVAVWKTVLGGVWDFIQDVWSRSPLKFVIDNWDAIMAVFHSGVDKVKGVLNKAWEFIKSIWSNSPLGIIVSNWDAIVAAFTGIPDKIKDALSRVRDVMFAPFKAAFNWIADGWNNSVGKLSFTVPDIPGVPGRGEKFTFPKIPKLATGGEILAGGWAQVGERGPELVKLPTGSTVYSNRESAKAMSSLGGASGNDVLQRLDRLIEATRSRSSLLLPDGTVLARTSTSGQRFIAALGGS